MGHYRIKHFTCWEQFSAMAIGRLSFRESLPDIVVCLGAQRGELYHLGFREVVGLSTLARANERRDWRIWRDFIELLIAKAHALCANDHPIDLDLNGTAYLIDSTMIKLCLNIFP